MERVDSGGLSDDTVLRLAAVFAQSAATNDLFGRLLSQRQLGIGAAG